MHSIYYKYCKNKNCFSSLDVKLRVLVLIIWELLKAKGTKKMIGHDDSHIFHPALLCPSASRHCPPICPVGVTMDADRPNSALLTWVPSPNSPTSSRSIFVLERQEVGSQEWLKCHTSETATSAEVGGDSVPCEGDYRFRVCCINKYGRSGHVEFPKAVHLGETMMCYFCRIFFNTICW